MTPASESSTTHIRPGHRVTSRVAGAERHPDGTGGTVSTCRNEVDPRFQRIAHLAGNIEGLSELTRTMILRRVERQKKQSVHRRQSARANDRGMTPAATPQPESISSEPGHCSAPERVKRIEHLLSALRRAYEAVNKFMAAGGSTDHADTDGDRMW